MTKRLSKSLAVLFLSMVMVFAAVIPAFAESSSITYVENHSVVDCVHRYKNNDGTFTFTIKLPKGRNLIYTSLAITKNSDGDVLYSTTILGNQTNMTYLYSDDTSDYYNLVLSKYSDEGIGIKLYHSYFDQDKHYMATDTANGSTTEGRGYWLSA